MTPHDPVLHCTVHKGAETMCALTGHGALLFILVIVIFLMCMASIVFTILGSK